MSSDHSSQDMHRTDYVHNEPQFQAVVSATINQNPTLNDAIRSLYTQGYGMLFICRGLVGRSNEEPAVTKRRVVRVINDLIAEQESNAKTLPSS
jgi:hypothetical protein